jgi:hypothetical protein
MLELQLKWPNSRYRDGLKNASALGKIVKFLEIPVYSTAFADVSLAQPISIDVLILWFSEVKKFGCIIQVIHITMLGVALNVKCYLDQVIRKATRTVWYSEDEFITEKCYDRYCCNSNTR